MRFGLSGDSFDLYSSDDDDFMDNVTEAYCFQSKFEEFVAEAFAEEIEIRKNKEISSHGHKLNPFAQERMYLQVDEELLQSINIEELRDNEELYQIILPLYNRRMMKACISPDTVNLILRKKAKRFFIHHQAAQFVSEITSIGKLALKLKKTPPNNNTIYTLPLDIGNSHFDLDSWNLIFSTIDEVISTNVSEKVLFLIWNTLLRDERIKNAKFFYQIETFLGLFDIKPFSNSCNSYRNPYLQFAIDSAKLKKKLKEEKTSEIIGAATSPTVSVERSLRHKYEDDHQNLPPSKLYGFTAGKVLLTLMYFTESKSNTEVKSIVDRYFSELCIYVENIELLLYLFYTLHYSFGLFRHNPNTVDFIIEKLSLGITRIIYEMK